MRKLHLFDFPEVNDITSHRKGRKYISLGKNLARKNSLSKPHHNSNSVSLGLRLDIVVTLKSLEVATKIVVGILVK